MRNTDQYLGEIRVNGLSEIRIKEWGEIRIKEGDEIRIKDWDEIHLLCTCICKATSDCITFATVFSAIYFRKSDVIM